jgi:WD40 repeat protein
MLMEIPYLGFLFRCYSNAIFYAIKLSKVESGKLLITFQGHTGWVRTAVFSPDDRRVLTASDDCTARLWEAESGKLLATFEGHTDISCERGL